VCQLRVVLYTIMFATIFAVQDGAPVCGKAAFFGECGMYGYSNFWGSGVYVGYFGSLYDIIKECKYREGLLLYQSIY